MAWLKLRLFLHADDVEVAGFGISDERNFLYIEDFATVKQTVTAVTVQLDDDEVADHFDRCVDAGIQPGRCGRVWIHTHPGDSPHPSVTDELTFERVFGDCDWAIMAIVARGGASYARLRFNAGPGGETKIPVRVDWNRFPQDLMDSEGSLDQIFGDWMDEYGRNVLPEVSLPAWPLKVVMPKLRRMPYSGPIDQLDDLYDCQSLNDEFSVHFDDAIRSAQEVNQWT